MFKKILIANRGEIALRIHRACRELGIKTVAVHSTADSEAMHVRLANEAVCIGPPQAEKSYLNMPSILAAAEISGADAIHPGYGFLAENEQFASIVEAHGITFIGPSPEHIRRMGNKVLAKETMLDLGVQTVPGSNGSLNSLGEARSVADSIGYPVLIKASAGGGGRGMKIAPTPNEIEEAFQTAGSEAKAAFGDATLYLEKLVSEPRHIEIQILADGQGNVIHLGDRDCSMQRRHQKILEEAPAPNIPSSKRDYICRQVVAAIKALNYRGAGTIEFLYSNGEFYFIEMNTRLQVEHPITEMITGVDIVKDQILIATGAPLKLKQSDVTFTGHAVECRINAEDPNTFAPDPGLISDYHPPGGLGVRVDSAVYAGYQVLPHYDSLIAKIIVHGSNRHDCLMRLRGSLDEYVIGGLKTTLPLHQTLVNHKDFLSANYNIQWLEEFIPQYQK